VQELFDCGSDVNVMTKHGVALNIAADKERSHVITMLFDARADMTKAFAFVAERGQSVVSLSFNAVHGSAGVSSIDDRTRLPLRRWVSKRSQG
jgi:hypothetical protein